MFIRRVFYDHDTGAVLRCYSAYGALAIGYTAEAEAAAVGLENWGVLEWNQPDEDIEAQFSEFDADGNPRLVDISVDVTVEPPRLVFAYSPIPTPEPHKSEIDAALEEMGVNIYETA